MDFLTARSQKPYALVINDPQPVQGTDLWMIASQAAVIGIFVIVLVSALYFARPVLLPVTAAFIIGMTLGPLIKWSETWGVPPWITALVLVGGLLLVAAVAVTLLSAPVAEWIARAPEIGATIKQKFYVLDRPIAALRDLQEAVIPKDENAVKVETSEFNILAPLVSMVTPALAQAVVFFATLVFFLIGQNEFRRELVAIFSTREAKLRFLRISNDIENNLWTYVSTFTVINVCLGIVVAAGAWAYGFPSPIIFGVLAMMLNYLPYIGPACMVMTLLAVGLVTFPSLSYALAPPASFIALTTIEGQFITPMVLGHRLTLNPLTVFLAIAFWAWLWGPMGAFLAVPLTIVGLVIFNHLFPSDDIKLPG